MANVGSLAAKAVEHLQALDEGTRLTSEELAAAIGYEGTSLAQCLAGARKRGELVAEREGKGLAWLLPDEEDDTPVPFNAAMYLDGDLVIQGVEINEDGSITLKADQVAKIKRLIVWAPAA